jgi:hypothetical protein
VWVRGFLSFRRRRQRARSTMYSILWPAAEQHHFHVQLPRVLRAPGMLSILHAQRGDGCRTRRLALSLVFGHSQPCPRTAHGIMTNDEMEPRYSESGLGHRESHARENETIMLFAGVLPVRTRAGLWRARGVSAQALRSRPRVGASPLGLGSWPWRRRSSARSLALAHVFFAANLS